MFILFPQKLYIIILWSFVSVCVNVFSEKNVSVSVFDHWMINRICFTVELWYLYEERKYIYRLLIIMEQFSK